MTDFQSSLRTALAKCEMTQVELAKRSGLSAAYVNHLLSGFRAPGPKVVAAIIDALPTDQERKLVIEGYSRYCLSEVQKAIRDQKSDAASVVRATVALDLAQLPTRPAIAKPEMPPEIESSKEVRLLANDILQALAKYAKKVGHGSPTSRSKA